MRAFQKSFILGSLLFAACHQPANVTSQPDAGLQSASSQHKSNPLPISGTWMATEVFSHTQDSNGQRSPVHLRGKQLDERLWRVEIDVDSEGFGTIQGKQSCQGLRENNSTPSRVRPYQILNAMFGLLNLASLISRTVEDVNCAQSQDGLIAGFVIVSATRNFFGKPVTSLPKNLGVFGEEHGLSKLDAECRSLRGVRFVNIKDASACVGFSDAAANNIRFLILPVGEIYALRVNMERD